MPRLGTPLHSCRSLDQSLSKLRRLDEPSQYIAWSAFRQARRLPEDLSELGVASLAKTLCQRIAAGNPYSAVMLGVKLAQARCLFQLKQAGASARAQRARVREGFHLLRLAVRSALGMRDPEDVPVLRFGQECSSPVQAWCDAGVRQGRGAAGIWVPQTAHSPHIAIARFLPLHTALAAELEAAHLCLQALLTLGLRAVQLNVDSLGVFRAFQSRLALRFCIEESLLAQQVEQFEYLEVRLVPRAFNERADQLATSLLLTQYEKFRKI